MLILDRQTVAQSIKAWYCSTPGLRRDLCYLYPDHEVLHSMFGLPPIETLEGTLFGEFGSDYLNPFFRGKTLERQSEWMLQQHLGHKKQGWDTPLSRLPLVETSEELLELLREVEPEFMALFDLLSGGYSFDAAWVTKWLDENLPA